VLFADRFAGIFKRLLPAPFTIAVLLTFVTFFLTWGLTSPTPGTSEQYPYWLQLLGYWEAGLWNNALLVFAIQMMLMLVLGHVLALTKPVDRLIQVAVRFCTNSAKAAALVTFLTVMVSLFNWGLGLIFGAIFARKVAEFAKANGIAINYPLIGAAGYSGLMVWHGGFSGSSLIKVAEDGHLKKMMEGIFSEEQLQMLPEAIHFDQTVFSSMNITVSILLLLVLPAAMYIIGKNVRSEAISLKETSLIAATKPTTLVGAEKLDYAKSLAFLFGGIILGLVFYKAVIQTSGDVLRFFTPNNINLLLLGLCLVLHGHFNRFLQAIDSAIAGASGILIQFPLYFGIMGLMKSSGLVVEFSDFFISISNATTYPILTFFSAGIVNIFVPSGGGQWAVQGPIIVQAASDLGLPLSKSIMAMAYGDQVTNMLQPFWALPLLGITGLRAKEILPYTLLLMLIGTVLFIGALLIF